MKTRFTSLVAIFAASVGLAFAIAQPTQAATITVSNTNDSGTGSLRQALADANDGDTIDFSVTTPATITLTSGQVTVGKSVTISGPGANVLAVNGSGASRVFNISSGKTVTISGLTITNGSAPSDSGGGIYNDHSTLTVSNCNVSGNFAAAGGGIVNDGSTSGSATMTIINSTVSANQSGGAGGGIVNDGSTSGSATMTIENSTVSGNFAGSAAGAIFNSAGHGTATLTIRNSTFSGNSSSPTPGDIRNDGSTGSATLTIGSTILKAGTSASIANVNSGTVNSLGYNLSSDAAGGDGTTGPGGFLNQTGDQRNTDPKLGPLAYYGGPTPTHILKTGSPAIDAGKNFSGATFDQRGVGFARTVGSAAVTGGDGTDIGAFERQASDIDPTLIVTTTADTSLNSTCDPANPCSLRDAITAANAVSGEDIIYFAVTGTIQLGSALPALNSDMKILGPGANALTVQRSSATQFRIFTVNSGKTVTISGLAITNGSAIEGGGIRNDHGTLTVNNCTVSGNSANNGGGIENFGEFSGTATLTVSNCTFSDNSTASLGTGGGIRNTGQHGGSATVTVVNTTLSGNSAQLAGGAIENAGGDSGSAPLTIKNSTLSGNSAPSGGGIDNEVATLTIGSTILKAGGSGANISNANGSVTSHGYNLSSDDASAFLNQTGDQNSTDPKLGPLQDNGGPTFTHALLPTSPAIDKGINPDSLATDQRGPGFDRTYDSGVANASGGDGTDIGAFEVQNTPPTITGETISQAQGTTSTNVKIATVSDNEDPPATLTVTVNSTNPSNGVTVSANPVDGSGNVTATVAASCSATNATFTLRVTDPGGLYAQDTLTVNVTANATPPVITLTGTGAKVLKQSPNHSYKTFTIADMVQSASDDCDGDVINNVVIEKVTSDEPDNSPGPGDGNTINDIVIASGCKSVQLRAERDGTKDGRVYHVTLGVKDNSGNVGEAVYTVSVPVGKGPAVDSGVDHTVTGCTP
jgi:CSLREA domain-containing protein